MRKGWLGDWFSKTADAVSLWSAIPAGVLALIAYQLSKGVVWISQFGAWGWFMSGFFIFVAFSVTMALIARTRLWRIEAKRQELITGESSAFDPMGQTYERKRLYLRDLAPAGRRLVQGRIFINCEIIGPGTIILMMRSNEQRPWPSMSENLMIDSDVVQIDSSSASALAIAFPDCSFHNCRFFHLTLLFYERSGGPNWNWITPDFNQPKMLEAIPSDPIT